MNTLSSIICRNCGATIYGYKVLIKTLSSNDTLNNSFSQHKRRKRTTWDFGVQRSLIGISNNRVHILPEQSYVVFVFESSRNRTFKIWPINASNVLTAYHFF